MLEVSGRWLQSYVNKKYQDIPQEVNIQPKPIRRLTLQMDELLLVVLLAIALVCQPKNYGNFYIPSMCCLLYRFLGGLSIGLIAIASYVRTKPKPKRGLRRFAPQSSFGFYVLTCLAIAISVFDLLEKYCLYAFLAFSGSPRYRRNLASTF